MFKGEPNVRTVLRAISVSLVTMFAVAFGTPAMAVLINFDAPPDGTLINTYYFDPLATSVSFSNPNPFGGGPPNVYARGSSFNTSPGNVVSVLPTGFPPFNAFYGAVDGTLNRVLFDQILTVTVMAAAVATIEPLGTPQNKPFMQAWDHNNVLLPTVYFQGALPTNPLEVTSFQRLTISVPPCVGTPIQCAGYGISKVRFSSQQSQPGPPIYALFDDFQWNPPVCSAPVITNGNGSSCAGTINTDTCTNWTCDVGYTPQGSNPVCSNGSWTGTYSCAGPPVAMSPYYVADGDSSRMFIVSPAAVATQVNTYSLAYPIAVRRTVLLGQLYDVEAREFTLAGVPTGLSFVGNGSFGQLLDGTTDGVQWNYAIECCSSPNSIVRTNTEWRHSAALFTAPGEGRGIAYDTRTNHLFVSILDDALIREYNLAGTLLNTFAVAGGPGVLVGLAYEQSTDSLWGKTRAGGTLYQFNKVGALLNTVPVAGLTPSNDFGGEMRIRPMIDVQSLEHVDNSFNIQGTSYAEDGFVITGTSLGTFGTLESRSTGSTALVEDTIGGVIELRSSDGSPFDLISIDLAELNGPSVAVVTFTGDLVGGGTVTQAFSLDGAAFGPEIFSFGPGFKDLTAVRWTQVSPFHQFDNIVAEVPEPSSGALIFAGTLGVLAAHAHRGGRRSPEV